MSWAVSTHLVLCSSKGVRKGASAEEKRDGEAEADMGEGGGGRDCGPWSEWPRAWCGGRGLEREEALLAHCPIDPSREPLRWRLRAGVAVEVEEGEEGCGGGGGEEGPAPTTATRGVAVEVVGVAVEVEAEVEAEPWPPVGSEVSREEEGAWCRDGGPPEAPAGRERRGGGRRREEG